MSSLSLIFAGTPEFSVPALDALVGAGHRVRAVYTQPDRPAGRGRQVTASAVKQCALRHGLPLEQPTSLRDAAAMEQLAHWRADLMIVVAYGLLLPEAVLRTPRLGCVNIHASLLPRWRGAAPIQRAILAGDEISGVTIMQMDAGLDTGAMLLERSTPLSPRETGSSLHDRLSAIGAEALMDALRLIDSGAAEPKVQPADGATYAHKIRKEDAVIDWTRPAIEIDRQVRAFDAWPIAETRWQGQQLRIWAAEPVNAPNAPTNVSAASPPGTVLGHHAGGIDVATGAGQLRLTRVQLAGRKALPAAAFAHAARLDGAVLGS